MTISDILMHVIPDAPAELERLEVGFDLARRVHARLTGVYTSPGTDGKNEWARALFERAASRTCVETAWRCVDGGTSDAFLFIARRSDLIVLPSCDVDRSLTKRLPELTIVDAGRPVLILPAPTQASSIGLNVLVGWNGSKESTRALHDAMPILTLAERVNVLSVATEAGLQSFDDVLLLEHLHQHGVQAQLSKRSAEEASEEIASEARKTDVDLVVLGLHVSSQSQPLEMGDVSQRFVRTGSLPVLFSN